MALALPNTFLQLKPSAPIIAARKLNCAAVGSNYRTTQVVVTCRKKDIHPEFHEDAKVYCNGELVMTTGGTQKEYSVDVWSGNHPFYLGGRSALVVDADQVEKFRKKFGGLSEIMEIPVLKGEIVLPTKRKSGAAKGGKKK
ncbi:50S ribosomal protein L31 [Melia azedarach]|uniref:50S ribosomal protein L31 n=1 Tax=Melia azedarach TaxID=155640 RepID=A0ACC1WRZ6_MELAZ|nr:50S ribosomal protein L31 [Melia azedarach]